MAWSPDGKRLATGSEDKTAKVWDGATGENLQILSRDWDAQDTRELMAIARRRVTDHPSTENCQKYLHSACPSFPKLSWW